MEDRVCFVVVAPYVWNENITPIDLPSTWPVLRALRWPAACITGQPGETGGTSTTSTTKTGTSGLTCWAGCCWRLGWRVHAWCQTTNLYHLVAETPEPNLADGMRQLTGVYTQAVNRRQGAHGSPVAGAVQGGAGGAQDLSLGAGALRSAQSSTRPHGGGAAAVALEQLPCNRGCGGRATLACHQLDPRSVFHARCGGGTPCRLCPCGRGIAQHLVRPESSSLPQKSGKRARLDFPPTRSRPEFPLPRHWRVTRQLLFRKAADCWKSLNRGSMRAR